MAQTKRKEPRDWHKAQIKAALEMRGTNLHLLGPDNGYAETSAYDVFRRPLPRMERIIADILGVEPWDIWPSRYDADNRPLSGLRAVAVKEQR
ncbi:helix-turn-helix domain-containing protein [Desulfatibacillum aliphaticivorans]|uniref:helix-turn-helix domain-containing protein n=1 Tax=Desulfatibacillum aliphaticivorans TaxID=218208 RepID=UPI000687A550|nr:helix-turn-helix domain-containing protein [Desulfatibacillum aliphaticivorans]